MKRTRFLARQATSCAASSTAAIGAAARCCAPSATITRCALRHLCGVRDRADRQAARHTGRPGGRDRPEAPAGERGDHAVPHRPDRAPRRPGAADRALDAATTPSASGAIDPEMPAGVYQPGGGQLAAAPGDRRCGRRQLAGAGPRGCGERGGRGGRGVADRDAARRHPGHFQRVEQIPSAELVAGLVAIEGRPWAEYGKTGKPITQNQLARVLKPLGIAPELDPDRGRGRAEATCSSSSKRPSLAILPPEGGSNRYSVTNADEMGTSDLFQTVTPESDVTVRNARSPITTGFVTM